MTDCEGCLEIEKLKLEVVSTQIEHETITTGLSTQMNDLREDFKELKDDVNKKLDGIPDMLENALNKMMARVAKWLLIGIVIIFAVIILAFTRPIIIKGLEELQQKVQKVEIVK